VTPGGPLAPVREAFTLPIALLTIAWAGGARLSVAGELRFEPPPLMALVLSVLLLALMARAGALATARLFSERRSALENASGALVFVALLAATAQVFHLLTPTRGLPNLFVNVLFLALLVNTFSRRTERRHLLNSLAVMFGSAFLLKYVVLDSMATGGAARRFFATAVEGLTLGALGLEAQPPVMGYLAFGVTALYLVVLWWLPFEPRRWDDGVRTAELLTVVEARLLQEGRSRVDE
jgi:hypothetical protein